MAAPRFCHNCGSALTPQQRFCESCGVSVVADLSITQAAESGFPESSSAAKLRSPTGGVSIAALLLLLLLSVCGSALYGWQELRKLNTRRLASAGGSCQSVSVIDVSSRFDAQPGQFGSEDGIINLSNGLSLYLYRTLRTAQPPGWGLSEASQPISLEQARALFRARDAIRLCLEFTPPDCPPGDERGRIYSLLNRRTGISVAGHYGRNACGGA